VVLPTGLTSISAAQNRDYHTQLAAALPWLGLPTSYTEASAGHLADHATLQDYWKLYGVAFDPVENQLGHIAAHERLHRFTNILTRVYGQQASYAQPPGSVSVAVGSFNQALVDSHSTGTVFWLQTGTHRPAAEVATMIVPKQGMEFHFAPGAILSGSVVLTGWTSDGAGHWYVTGQTQRGEDGQEFIDAVPTSPADHPRAWKSETLYIDNVIQKHQNALVDVGAGEWFFDYAANRIYIGTDPAGKVVETTLADKAIIGGGANVKIVNGIVEKFMCKFQNAAVEGLGVTGWQVIDTTVRLVHGLGLKNNDGGVTRGCKIDRNGQLGIGGGGTFTVEYTEVCENNALRVNVAEQGGSKFVHSTNAVVTDCWFRDSVLGPNLWFDINNVNPQMTWNLVERADHIGIFHEINFGGLIADNLTRGNGLDYGTFAPSGAGILVGTSTDSEVTRNSVIDNRGGWIWGTRDPRAGGVEGWDLRNLNVHDNLVVQHSGLGGGTDQPGGGIQDYDDGVTAYLPASNNRFQSNTYLVTSTTSNFWYWSGGPRAWASWRSIPQDSAGTATDDTDHPELAAGTLIAWFDAMRETGYRRVGAPVPRLPNWQGVSGPLAQATAANQPTTQHGINGRPAVRHDGISDYLATAAFGAVETQPNTVVMVVRFTSTPSGGDVLLDGNGATNRHIIYVDLTPQWRLWAGSYITSTGQTFDTSPHLLRALFDGANSKLWVDDVLVLSGNPGANSLGGITVGTWSDAPGGDPMAADWGQILVYAGDISANWTALRDHLESKWGI
jgi:hypothetical protein